ncbi:DUF4190 domain-containing protein [Evansella cellulosilytica]|uniref:DUF4190 domain-containing protein n=1 Tax=Evansella cellulosilytica (strain ATCC 21833 / DSM 2522 / FERM P-1141 / JCM 9156 / N-4) TaxID=649639 RepID=E6TVD1_EVAC2|nr:DUF4190 domain-containing protein [Evansella cellulosilytica]ADU30948.1 hypothetical protein Bcell_2693 [Evansella cellulosilytica DSM 2522]
MSRTTNPTIRQYLHDLSNELTYLSTEERRQQVLEIEGHLQSLVEEKKAQGKSDIDAAEEALEEFLPVDRLAEQIIDEVEISQVVKERNNGAVEERTLDDKQNGKAIAGLVLGICSIVFIIFWLFGIIIAVVGLVFSLLGLSEIKRTKQRGRKMAIAGLVCSIIGLLLPILLIIFSLSAYSNLSI